MKRLKVVILVIAVGAAGVLWTVLANPLNRLRRSASASAWMEVSTSVFPHWDGGRLIAVRCSAEDFLKFVTASELGKHEGGEWPAGVGVWGSAPSADWWTPPESPRVLYFKESRTDRTLCAYEDGVAYIEYAFY